MSVASRHSARATPGLRFLGRLTARLCLDALRRQAEAFAAWVRGGRQPAVCRRCGRGIDGAERAEDESDGISASIRSPGPRHAGTGGDIPLETCLAETRRPATAAPNSAASSPHISALRPILERHHLKLVSGWFDGRIRATWPRVRCHHTALTLPDLAATMSFMPTLGRQGFPPISQPGGPISDWPTYGRR
jgi:hypothetical protein